MLVALNIFLCGFLPNFTIFVVVGCIYSSSFSSFLNRILALFDNVQVLYFLMELGTCLFFCCNIKKWTFRPSQRKSKQGRSQIRTRPFTFIHSTHINRGTSISVLLGLILVSVASVALKSHYKGNTEATTVSKSTGAARAGQHFDSMQICTGYAVMKWTI